MKKLKVIDLFAGAGGLSLGFKQTQKYEIKAAFENNKCFQETYKKNHPNVDVYGDVCSADYKTIKEKYGAIDVVIGGPPCQGFSNANRQKNHAISQNNMLVKQYLRAILELRPKAFIMENVSMLRSEVHRFYLDKADLDIVNKYQIPSKISELPLIDAKFVFDDALEIIKNPELIEKNIWPEKDYTDLNVIYKTIKNLKKTSSVITKHRRTLENLAKKHISTEDNNYISKISSNAFDAIMQYYAGVRKIEELQSEIEPAIMIQRMLSRAKEIHDNNIIVDSYNTVGGISAKIQSFAVFDYLRGILRSPEYAYDVNALVLCAANYGAPQKRMRFVVFGLRKDVSQKNPFPISTFKENEFRTVRDAIADIEDVQPLFDPSEDTSGIVLTPKNDLGELAKTLRDSTILKNHLITKTTEVALERFRALKQGENFHSLKNELKENTYSDASRTQNTIYLRLKYDEPCGTVVNVRKSMWIHPTLDRAISVREAARLQTFPDSFVFCGSKDKQYQQVGNAVPPILARAIAEKLYFILTKKEGSNEHAKTNKKD